MSPPEIRTCPKCGFAQPPGESFCLKCGLVFAKYQRRQAKNTSEQTVPEVASQEEALELSEDHLFVTRSLGPQGWMAVGGGALLALLVLSLPRLDFIFQTFITLVHELGHALFGWLFGYPSIPAFDFMYGGGVTMHQQRAMSLVYGVLALLVMAAFVYRRNLRTLTALAIIAALYALCTFTRIHEVLNLFMGHGTELIIAGIFLYRGFSGFAVIHTVERPLYAFLGFFVLFSDLRFAWRLITDPVHRYLYEEAKGGGHWMDFSRIAEEYLRVDLSAVALFFLLCCLLPPLAIWVYRTWRTEILLTLNRLFDRNPA
ncbi:MAG: hypothetical protein C0624_01505 [Desulfuromonas sp.]|nr:MAG: hypothetical protein C0624_01505 [Desulfuromonas sp.]